VKRIRETLFPFVGPVSRPFHPLLPFIIQFSSINDTVKEDELDGLGEDEAEARLLTRLGLSEYYGLWPPAVGRACRSGYSLRYGGGYSVGDAMGLGRERLTRGACVCVCVLAYVPRG
jgi:hypothetical protein